jgi:polar amino acid transport system substrate-binding protein
MNAAFIRGSSLEFRAAIALPAASTTLGRGFNMKSTCTMRLLIVIATASLAFAATAAHAADMIGSCEMMGKKGEIPIAAPAKAGQLTVEVSLPAPTWWNGDTPDSIKDGFEYCMAANIAWRAGYDKMEVLNVSWDPLVSGQTKGFDLAISEISITDDRKKVVDFSVPYFSSDIGVLVKKGTSLDEKSIKEARIGVQSGTTGASFATDKLKPKSVNQYPEQGDMFTALRAGQIDAAITDTSIVLAEEVQEKGAVAVVGQYKTGEAYGALYPKGTANAKAFDQIIAALQADGTLKKLADKYLAAVWGKDPATVPYFNP